MKLGIMQPYFFPYIGYFQLINAVDKFILFDTPQFIRHGWIERNRILNQKSQPFYIKVPLIKSSRNTIIKNIKVNNYENWKEKIFAQLVHYKKRAPHYWKVISLLKDIFEINSDSIVEINHFSLNKTCEYIGIKTPIYVWSEMKIEIEEVNAPDEWALKICKALNATSYFNPIGGKSFFDKNKYIEGGIELNFISTYSNEYKQFGNEFIPFLSIIDVMMFNSKEEIKEMLNKYSLS